MKESPQCPYEKAVPPPALKNTPYPPPPPQSLWGIGNHVLVFYVDLAKEVELDVVFISLILFLFHHNILDLLK